MSRPNPQLKRRGVLGAIGIAIGAVAVWPWLARIPAVHALRLRITGRATVPDRLAELGEQVRARLGPRFETAGVAYPPGAVTLVALKSERVVELHVGPSPGDLRHIHTYPITGASGTLGPKLREGDRQVPEGLYEIDFLNPNSRYHLSLRLDYPNAADRRMAEADGRENLGGDIFIHGGSASIGCIALGDAAAEELFVLAGLTRPTPMRVIVSPIDFRRQHDATTLPQEPPWMAERYDRIAEALGGLSPDAALTAR